MSCRDPAQETAWRAFDPKWRAACTQEGLTRPFHMKDMSAFKNQFKGWNEQRRQRLLGKLISAIRQAKAIPIGSVVSVKDFNAFEPRLRGELQDPYFMAFQTLTYNIAATSMEMPPKIGSPFIVKMKRDGRRRQVSRLSQFIVFGIRRHTSLMNRMTTRELNFWTRRV